MEKRGITQGLFGKKMAELGIDMHTSLPYEHEQNGLAERLKQTILDKAQSILINSGLDKKYWLYAVATATFATNRSPYADQACIPFEAFTNMQPNFECAVSIWCVGMGLHT